MSDPITTVPPAPSTSAQAGEPVLDPAALHALGQLRPKASAEFILQVLRTYLKTLAKYVPQVELGWRGHELHQVAENAHALKSSSASIGARAFAETCRAVEQAGRQNQMDVLNELMPQFCAQAEEVAQAVRAMPGVLT